MPDDAWTGVREELTRRLAALGPDDAVVLAEPGGKYVQVARAGDDLVGECVSAAFADVDDAQDAAVRALGWLAPADQPGDPSENYVLSVPRGDAPQLADRAVAALGALGVAPDAAWEWQEIGF